MKNTLHVFAKSFGRPVSSSANQLIAKIAIETIREENVGGRNVALITDRGIPLEKLQELDVPMWIIGPDSPDTYWPTMHLADSAATAISAGDDVIVISEPNYVERVVRDLKRSLNRQGILAFIETRTSIFFDTKDEKWMDKNATKLYTRNVFWLSLREFSICCLPWVLYSWVSDRLDEKGRLHLNM